MTRSPRHPWCSALVCALAGTLVAACAADDTDAFATKASPIAQGQLAPEATAVVFVKASEGSGAQDCSGALIMPDLILTAAHCLTGQSGSIDCETTTLDAPLSAESFSVSNAPDLTGAIEPAHAFVPAVAVKLLAEPGEPLCGNDLALLTLAAPLSNATPHAVSITSPSAANTYTALGYGAGHVAGTGERVRRQVDGAIECIGDDCNDGTASGFAGAPAVATPPAAPNEFVGSPGPCAGDSGGPALNADGDVIGILSRGLDGCIAPVFGMSHAALAEAVREHAALSGAAVPDWAELEEEPSDPSPTENAGGSSGGSSTTTPSSPTPPASTSKQGCQHAPTRPGSWPTLLILLAAVGAAFVARQRHSKDKTTS